MIATPTPLAPVPSTIQGGRLFVRKQLPRPDVRRVAAGTAWLAVFALLAIVTSVLWQQGIMSSELLFWEARRRLIVSVQPPDLTTLISTDPALVLFLLLPFGPVAGGVAVLGTLVMVTVSAMRRWVGLGGVWLPLLLIQPGVGIALSQYPSALVRGILLLAVLVSPLAYLRGPRVVLLLSAALCLGALTLVDSAPWPVWGTLGLVFWIYQPPNVAHVHLQERTSLLLVTFFPSVFLLLAWQYLTWTMGISRWSLEDAPATLYALAPSAELARAWHAPAVGYGPLVAAIEQLAIFGPAYVAAVMLALVTARRQLAGWTVPGMLLLLAPAVDLVLRALLGHGRAAPLDSLTPVFAVIVAAGLLSRRARIVVALALLVSGILGWSLLLRADADEPSRLARQALGLSAAAPFGPLREIATTVNLHREPGETVLLDDMSPYPIVALVDRPQSLLLPYRREFGLAIQQPERFAEPIMTTDPQAIPALAQADLRGPSDRPATWRLVTRTQQIFVYESVPALASPGRP